MTGLIVAMSGGNPPWRRTPSCPPACGAWSARACWSPSATSTWQLGHRHRRRQRLRLRPAVGGHRVRAAGPGLPGAGVAAGAGHGPDLATLTARHLSPHGQGRLAGRRGRHSRDRAGRAGRRRHRAAPAVRPAPAGRRGGDRRRHLRRTGADARQRRPPRTRHRRAAGHRGRIVRVLLFKANPAWTEVAQGVARTGGSCAIRRAS